jgi:hypothetical protein
MIETWRAARRFARRRLRANADAVAIFYHRLGSKGRWAERRSICGGRGTMLI